MSMTGFSAKVAAAGFAAGLSFAAPLGTAYADTPDMSSPSAQAATPRNVHRSGSAAPLASARSKSRAAAPRAAARVVPSASAVLPDTGRTPAVQATATPGAVPAAPARVSSRQAAVVSAVTAPVVATAWTGPVATIATAISTSVRGVLNTSINWLAALPGGPITDLVQGALMLVRRLLFPVPSAIGVDLSTTFASPAPSYQSAVGIINQLGITSIRMYAIDTNALGVIQAQIPNATVTVEIPNSQVSGLDTAAATAVVASLQPYSSIVKTIVVGNEVDSAFGGDLSPVTTAVQNMQAAISAAGLSTPVTVSFTMGLIANSYPPSNATLNPALNGLTTLLGALTNSVEIDPYPLIDLNNNPVDISLAYALGQSSSAPVVDNGVTYHSLFWAEYDAVKWALQKASINLAVNVGETGWATSSTTQSPYSTVANAQIYNQNIITSILGTGSPAFGTTNFPFYLFEFNDENLKPGGLFEPYWGWYSVSGSGALNSKYSLSL